MVRPELVYLHLEISERERSLLMTISAFFVHLVFINIIFSVHVLPIASVVLCSFFSISHVFMHVFLCS